MIHLSVEDKKLLLTIARKTLQKELLGIDFDLTQLDIPEHLMQNGASFVTLTINGRLRGCIGALSAYQPLVQDVCEHAIAAALDDPRFPVLGASELEKVTVEVSYLTPPEPLDYLDGQDLVSKLRPGVDGVILQDGFRRATYLPQVWEQIPDTEEFLRSLCQKMGARGNLWRDKHLTVQVYQAIHFSETEFDAIA